MDQPFDDCSSPADEPLEWESWPPSFPHREIDALIERLDDGRSFDRGDAYRLLALVAKEAQRLRSTAVRLAAAKLSEADREAREVVAEAIEQADAMRATGLSILNSRLDDGERLLATMRDAFRAELRSSELARGGEVEPGAADEDPHRTRA